MAGRLLQASLKCAAEVCARQGQQRRRKAKLRWAELTGGEGKGNNVRKEGCPEKKCLHFPFCACHPCAGAMLFRIFKTGAENSPGSVTFPAWHFGLFKKRMPKPSKTPMSGVAQWLACWAHNPKVRGSKPCSAMKGPSGCLGRPQDGERASSDADVPCCPTCPPSGTAFALV